MKLGILGGTTLAKTLGTKYLESGLSVVFGVRSDFDTMSSDWRLLNRLYTRICPYESAVIQSEIILICCENEYLPEILDSLKNVDIEGKLIVDCTNSCYDKLMTKSNTHLILEAAPKAILFKGFNNLGIDYPQSDRLDVIKETYFCGNSDSGKIRIKRLIELIGFLAVDAGKMENAPLLEAFYHLGREIRWNQKEPSTYHFKLVTA